MSALLLKLKLHTEEELSEEEVSAKSGLDRLRATIEETVDALGDAYDDEAVRADARAMATAFVDALDATVAEVRERVSRS